jgi:hypothetical protein
MPKGEEMKSVVKTVQAQFKTVEPKKIRFTVEMELENGSEVMVFNGVEAQTRAEAIKKVQESFIFTANKGV